MTDPDENIRQLAKRFREASERCPRNRLPISCENFPTGSCGDVTLLLSKYLESNGEANFGYALGMRAGGSHAWLARSELIVDITADQFDDQDAPVIVTRQSPWHATFRLEPEDQQIHADFELYDDNTAFTLAAAYRAVIEHLR